MGAEMTVTGAWEDFAKSMGFEDFMNLTAGKAAFMAGSFSMFKRIQYIQTLSIEAQEHYITELTKELNTFKESLGS